VLIEREGGVLYIISSLRIDIKSIRIDTRYRIFLPRLSERESYFSSQVRRKLHIDGAV
jgi:hypothetical protein